MVMISPGIKGCNRELLVSKGSTQLSFLSGKRKYHNSAQCLKKWVKKEWNGVSPAARYLCIQRPAHLPSSTVLELGRKRKKKQLIENTLDSRAAVWHRFLEMQEVVLSSAGLQNQKKRVFRRTLLAQELLTVSGFVLADVGRAQPFRGLLTFVWLQQKRQTGSCSP